MAPFIELAVTAAVASSLATTTTAPNPYAPVGYTESAPSLFTSATTEITSHGPYSGTPTTTGAEHASTTLSQTISPLPNTAATYHNYNGKLTAPEVIPYQPFGKIASVQTATGKKTNQ
jgi:hypothetical protein